MKKTNDEEFLNQTKLGESKFKKGFIEHNKLD